MSTSRLLRILLVAGAMALTAAQPTWAQSSMTGEISGFVRDATGLVLPGVTLTVSYPSIGFTRSTVTDSKGYYILPGLPNTTADVSAELAGFQTITRKGVVVEIQARIRIDLTLPLAGVTESVQVVGEAGELISTRADVSQLISGLQTKEMPIDGRSYMQLLSIVPGVSRNEGSYEFGTSFRADGQQINGLRKNFSALTLDGAENLDAGSNATQVNNVSIDAIEEVKVMTSQYSAEFGKAGGAQINVVTKSGTRAFHGNASYFLRSDQFDAKNFKTGQKDVLDFKNFGWNLGGPIGGNGFNQNKSKLFFFVGEEWKKLNSQVGLTKSGTTPSLLERQGDFSQSPKIPNDPLTGKAFPGGLIPQSRMSQNALNLISRFPLPDAGTRNLVTVTPTQVRDIREDIVKIDYRPSSSSVFSGRYIKDVVDQIEPYGSFGGTSNYAQVPTSHVRYSDSVMLSYNQTLGPRVFNEAFVSAVRNDQDLNQTGEYYARTGLNIPEIFPLNRNFRAPNIRSMTGYSLGTGLMGVDYPTHLIGNYYTFKDNLTISRGEHTFKAGVYVGHFRKTEEVRTSDAGSYAFADSQKNATGVALANALLGIYDQYTESDIAPLGNMRYNEIEVYAQDHWQVARNFTLDYGVRYQYMPAIYERNNQIATFDPALYNPGDAPQLNSSGNLVPGTGLLVNGMPVTGVAVAGTNGVPRGLYAGDTNNIAPRVGFTWDPFKTGKTAIRGGFGLFYDRPVTNSTRDQGASVPLVRTVTLTSGSLDNPAGGAASTAPPSGFEALARDFPSPTVYQWSVGVQRQLPWKIVADVNYVSNKAYHLLRVRELNYVAPDQVTGVAGTPSNNYRTFRGYGRIMMNETTGESDYQGLQVAINRRAAQNFSFGLAYTLSRSRGDSDSEDSTSSGSMAQDPRNVTGEYGYQDFDRRHVLSVNYIWSLPWYRGQRNAAGYVLGGWQVSGITNFRTGRRLNITAATNTALFGDTVTLRGNLVPGMDPNSAPEGGRTETQWLNIAAFARPATNQLGTLPRNAAQGPSFLSTDLSVSKSFPIRGSVKLQVRVDVFNLFNQRNYKTVETSMTNTNFGMVTEYEAQRILQFGAKITF